jgi:hypothetical protein
MAINKPQPNNIWDDNMIVTTTGLSPINTGSITMNTVSIASSQGTFSTVSAPKQVDEILDLFDMNELVVEHKVTTFELAKLKETVDYHDIIKQNLSKKISDGIINKARFTKKQDLDSDTISFRGRVWVFNKEELLDLIKEVRNV